MAKPRSLPPLLADYCPWLRKDRSGHVKDASQTIFKGSPVCIPSRCTRSYMTRARPHPTTRPPAPGPPSHPSCRFRGLGRPSASKSRSVAADPGRSPQGQGLGEPRPRRKLILSRPSPSPDGWLQHGAVSSLDCLVGDPCKPCLVLPDLSVQPEVAATQAPVGFCLRPCIPLLGMTGLPGRADWSAYPPGQGEPFPRGEAASPIAILPSLRGGCRLRQCLGMRRAHLSCSRR